MDAACDAFYGIYSRDKQSNLVNDILGQLDFHPLSITLLATVAQQNRWDTKRLLREWEKQQTGVLHLQHNKSLAATIELSLTSPMFQELGPDACDLLGVVAFFPQGVDENNLDWLFLEIPDRTNIFDHFCTLSLAYRSNGFITMLAPLRDHLCPKDPKSSRLLCTTKNHYFSRLSIHVSLNKPGFEETQWIISEDVNIEHLLDVFTTIDTTSDDVWEACGNFIKYLSWHKPRLVMLGPKIERLPDDCHFKQISLISLSLLFSSVGNHVGSKQVLICALESWGVQDNDQKIAHALTLLSGSNYMLGHYKETILQAKEALEIHRKFGNTDALVNSLQLLALASYNENQLAEAEEAASQAINLLTDNDNPLLLCQSHNILGKIYHSKGEKEKAVHHLEAALSSAYSLNWDAQLSRIHFSLAVGHFNEGRSNDAHAHLGHAKLHATNNSYLLGLVIETQAYFWYKQCRLEEARSEALCAIDIWEKHGPLLDLEKCRVLLGQIESKISNPVTSDEPGDICKPLETVLLVITINLLYLGVRATPPSSY